MTTANTAAAESKVKTVLEDMPSRQLFDSTADAAAAIQRLATELSDFGAYPTITAGFTEDGDFDPAIYTDAMQVTIAKLTEKGSAKEGRESRVTAIVIYPTPRLSAILEDAAARDWLESVIAKECNLIAMRPVRKATTLDEMADAQQAMPTTIAEYITSNRETSSGILDTYNALWQLIKKALGERYKSFALANLSKKELRKGIESASYASTVYDRLENRQNKKGEKESFFELAARFGSTLAKAQGLDPAFFDRALESRNEKVIEVADEDEGEDFDFEAMAAKLTAPAAEPATSNESSDLPIG